MRKFVNFRPVVFLCGGLILGVLLAYFITCGDLLGIILTALFGAAFSTVSVFFSATSLKPALKTVFILLFCAFAICGFLSFDSSVKNYNNANVGGHSLHVCGRISEITFKDGYADAVIEGVSVSGVLNGSTDYKIQAIIYGETVADIGDRVEFDGVLIDRTAFYRGKFSGAQVAEKVKYFIELSADDLTVTGSSANVFQVVHKYLRDALKSGMTAAGDEYNDEFAVAYALLVGNSDYISEQTLSSYRSAGVAHIFAVSGLHIGVLATAVFFLLKLLRLNDKAAFFIAFALCLFYAGVCGFSASALRAALMFAVLNAAKRFGFKYDGLSSLFFAAFIILLLSPTQLFCVGFQLSFSVVFTVVVLMGRLNALFGRLPEKLRALVSLSISAEIGGLPIMLLAVGNFPAFSVFINILFIPVISVLFIILLILTVLGGAFAPTVFLFLPKYAIFGLNKFFGFFDMRAFLISGLAIGGYAAVYFLAVAVAGGLINLKRTVKTVTVLILSAVVVFGVSVSTADENRGMYAEATGSETLSAVLFRHRQENLLVITDVNYIFSANGLKRAAAKSDGNLTVVILSGGKGVDIQVVYTKLKNYVFVSAILYAGSRAEDAEYVLYKEYPELSVKNVRDGDAVTFCGETLTVAGDGRALSGKVGNYDVAVIAPIDGGELPDLKFKDGIVFCTNGAAATFADGKYSPVETVSLRYSPKFRNAESENPILRLDKRIIKAAK